MRSRNHQSLNRRAFLAHALRAGTGLAALPLAAACGEPAAPPGLRIPRSQLSGVDRLVVLDGDLPVELARQDGRLVARSLLCTHQGCRVEWRETEDAYFCPCHEGVFDASGKPILGPPDRALREFPLRTDPEFVYVDTHAPWEAP